MFGAIAGALVGGLMSAHSAKKQASQNADLSRDNWIYQQSNAHQLEVQDLRNAGLNPILSATNSQMAGMSPVTGSDPGNFANNISSALQGFLDRSAKQEMHAGDLELEKMKLENEKLRTQIDRDRADSDIKLDEKQGNLLDVEAEHTSAKTVNESNETAARIKHITNQISNENKLTEAQVDKLRSGVALDHASIDKLTADTKLSIEQSNLTYWEKNKLITSLTDSSAQLKRMNAQQQLEYLSTDFGEVSHKFGFGLKLVSPIQGVGIGSNGYSNVRF